MSNLDECVKKIVKYSKGKKRDPSEFQPLFGQLLNEISQSNGSALDKAMESIVNLIKDEDIVFGFFIANICGSCLERGANPKIVGFEIINFVKKVVNNAFEFGQLFEQILKQNIPVTQQHIMEDLGRKKPLLGVSFKLVEGLGPLISAVYATDKDFRKITANDQDLYDKVNFMASRMHNLRFITEALFLIDNEPLLVLHPKAKKGFIVEFEGVSSLNQLDVLLADKIIGDPNQGLLEGKKPDLAVVQAFSINPGSKSLVASMAFELCNYTGLISPDTIGNPWKGTLNILGADGSKWLDHECVPVDIKKLGNQRILLIDNAVINRTMNGQKTFPKMIASLNLIKILSEEQVSFWINKIMVANKSNTN
jgi:hypothetical protein